MMQNPWKIAENLAHPSESTQRESYPMNTNMTGSRCYTLKTGKSESSRGMDSMDSKGSYHKFSAIWDTLILKNFMGWGWPLFSENTGEAE